MLIVCIKEFRWNVEGLGLLSLTVPESSKRGEQQIPPLKAARKILIPHKMRMIPELRFQGKQGISLEASLG